MIFQYLSHETWQILFYHMQLLPSPKASPKIFRRTNSLLIMDTVPSMVTHKDSLFANLIYGMSFHLLTFQLSTTSIRCFKERINRLMKSESPGLLFSLVSLFSISYLTNQNRIMNLHCARDESCKEINE